MNFQELSPTEKFKLVIECASTNKYFCLTNIGDLEDIRESCKGGRGCFSRYKKRLKDKDFMFLFTKIYERDLIK